MYLQRIKPGLPAPAYAHPGDAGLDLYAAHAALAALLGGDQK